jgi:iron complex outermembrane receptor protein
LSNCAANGADPTSLDNNGIQVYGMEIKTGGAQDIREETSESLSMGFVWDQPFFDNFDMSFSFSYYDIEITDEIIEPSAQFIINDCYNDREGNSTFCTRIDRDNAPGEEFIDLLNSGFINRDSLKTRGMDFNIAYDQTVSWFNRAVDLSGEITANRILENSRLFLDDEGTPDFTELVGRFGFPEWNGRLTIRADVEKYRLTWSTRYLGAVSQDPLFADPYDFVPNGFADTCLGIRAGDVSCRDVGHADHYITHDVSLFYRGDTWMVGGGLRNVFNQSPPLVDSDEVFAVNNTPLGYGYDLIGRMAYLNIAAHFE